MTQTLRTLRLYLVLLTGFNFLNKVREIVNEIKLSFPTLQSPLGALDEVVYGSSLAFVDRVEDACSQTFLTSLAHRLAKSSIGPEILGLSLSLKVDK